MKNLSVFVCSSDAYSDLWPIFFDLFHKYWPQYNGAIYLNTENKTYKHPHLNIICTNVGHQSSFGKTLRKGLDKVETEDILLLMIDFIFMGDVNTDKMAEYFKHFKDHNLDSICLYYQNYRAFETTSSKDILNVIPPSKDMFSFQTAFWKKTMLYEMALPHENPWTSEWFGTKRANKIKLKLACLAKDVVIPINYDLAGCLHKGQWLENAKEHLESINYKIDYSKRGFYVKPKASIKQRLKAKRMYVSHGLKGSYWDLMRR
ncbi:hypothetical protein [Algibacter sp. L4_22]|uniref:hypothetical protein n=1 Tax=Algibacter sp. L4_22 TaxID=2942477 RepID=UPI00201B7C58|nr:hypothetical protein [Algibacter sp. L4_22]MCL5129857.1 hypothetical protein [Algibacter sp. L4_22]